jgi:LmbE family N-acetylglucosaminyl deacetylase
MGGTIARLAAAGSVPHVAFVTDGRASHPGHPAFGPEEIAALRRREAEAALAELGVGADRLAYLGGPDGRLDRLEPEEGRRLADGLRLALSRVRPDLVFLPTGADGSSEHRGAYDLVRSVLPPGTGGAQVLEFAVWAWWSPQRLLGPLRSSRVVWRSRLGPARAAKALAVAAYGSQCLPLPPQPAAALPPGFAACFDAATEYFFER